MLNLNKNWMHLSVFDLDYTLTTCNCSLAFCRYLIRQNMLSYNHLFYAVYSYFRYYILEKNLLELHRAIFLQALSGRQLSLLEQAADLFVEEYFNQLLYLPSVAHLKLAQHLGHYTLLLSNSPDFLVKKFALKLGFHAWKATDYAIDSEGKLSAVGFVLAGEQKAFYMLELAQKLCVDHKNITAYSDSHLDLPFLEAAGTAISVNPDRVLKKVAGKNGWTVL
ncbi:HAD family hydrolase [Candidatus Rhabdochlamydia porcellionis]|uniref:Phosphatase n=1 Tax=Candidatus Rhabdochlamydia porcellionis TaxID=225148 RepID=A0ABX8YYV0_9BACT|nr:HAD-IB family hydrolase [Candidatus Rhabdochlamydia porcellionis]QZA58509.1 putative phosphatase [Candidatus Rhabdochlamydia porcellionis]